MPFGLPDANDIEKAGEGIEDHGKVVASQIIADALAQARAVLDEYTIEIKFVKKGVPTP